MTLFFTLSVSSFTGEYLKKKDYVEGMEKHR